MPYREGFFASRLRRFLDLADERLDLDRDGFARRIDQPADAFGDWCDRRGLPEGSERLRALAGGIARALELEETSVLAELRHAMRLDLLERALREDLEVSVETAADLLDELRLRT